jgi:hypothetical protein
MAEVASTSRLFYSLAGNSMITAFIAWVEA